MADALLAAPRKECNAPANTPKNSLNKPTQYAASPQRLNNLALDQRGDKAFLKTLEPSPLWKQRPIIPITF